MPCQGITPGASSFTSVGSESASGSLPASESLSAPELASLPSLVLSSMPGLSVGAAWSRGHASPLPSALAALLPAGQWGGALDQLHECRIM